MQALTLARWTRVVSSNLASVVIISSQNWSNWENLDSFFFPKETSPTWIYIYFYLVPYPVPGLRCKNLHTITTILLPNPGSSLFFLSPTQVSTQGIQQERQGLLTRDRLWSNKVELLDCQSDSTVEHTEKEFLVKCQVGRIQGWGRITWLLTGTVNP